MRSARRTRGAVKSYDPGLDRQALNRLQIEFSGILQVFCDHEPVLRGRLQILQRRCGKERCRCMRGKLHVSSVLVDSSSGSRRIRKVNSAQYLSLKKPTRKYQALRRLRARLSKLHQEVLGYCDRLKVHRLREGSRTLKRLERS